MVTTFTWVEFLVTVSARCSSPWIGMFKRNGDSSVEANDIILSALPNEEGLSSLKHLASGRISSLSC